MGEILTLYYLMENNLMDDHCFSPCTCKFYNTFKNSVGLNLDCLTGNHHKHQKFPIKISRYSVTCFFVKVQERKAIIKITHIN